MTMATVPYIPDPPKGFVDAFDNHFKLYGTSSKDAWRIKWRGQFITASSGKTLWGSSGAARGAFHRITKEQWFRNEWEKLYPESAETKTTSYGQSYKVIKIRPDLYKKLLHDLETVGFLEFVKLTQ